MADDADIDTDSLRETIAEPLSGSLLRSIALTTALLAAFATWRRCRPATR